MNLSSLLQICNIITIYKIIVFPQNESTRAEIEALVIANDVVKLKNILCRRMEFGTAGMFTFDLFLSIDVFSVTLF